MKKSVICCTVKLKLTPKQERRLADWLWHMTDVWNWTVKRIEHDAANRIYESSWTLEKRLSGHGRKIGVPQEAIVGTVRTAHGAWARCFKRLARRPHLKGRRNKLNSISLPFTQAPIVAGKVLIPTIGRVRFHVQDVPAGRIGCARLVRRASGWYICLFIKAEPKAIACGDGVVGIDPGFSTLITLSDGQKVEHPHELRVGAQRLAQSQRGRRLRLTARLLERQANRRKDRNHKLSRSLVERHRLIVWSADNSRGLARMFGKSVSSAGHFQLREMLAYKCRSGGARFIEVDSRRSTRTCSACGSLSGPAGYSGLKVRHWVCVECGVEHDRDVNAAVNTLNAGLGTSHERGREAASGIAI